MKQSISPIAAGAPPGAVGRLGGILVLLLMVLLVRGLSPVPGTRIDHRGTVVGGIVGVGLAVPIRVARRPRPAVPGKLRR